MLNINKTLEESKLTVALEGRLDTTTSPELEKSLNDSLPGVTELVMDLFAHGAPERKKQDEGGSSHAG